MKKKKEAFCILWSEEQVIAGTQTRVHWSLSLAMRCLWWRSVYKTSRQLKGHFATWHAAIFHLTSPPFSSISPCENQLGVISTLLLSFFGMYTLRFHDISIHHRFRNRGAPMLVPHASVWPDFFRPEKALEIRSASVEDRGQMRRGIEQRERLPGQLQAEKLLLQ